MSIPKFADFKNYPHLLCKRSVKNHKKKKPFRFRKGSSIPFVKKTKNEFLCKIIE